MFGETVDAFLKRNPNHIISYKDGKSYLIQNVSSSCRSLKHKTLLIDIMDGIEYVGSTFIQKLEGFEDDKCPPAECQTWCDPTKGFNPTPSCVACCANTTKMCCTPAGPGPAPGPGPTSGPTPPVGTPTPPPPPTPPSKNPCGRGMTHYISTYGHSKCQPQASQDICYKQMPPSWVKACKDSGACTFDGNGGCILKEGGSCCPGKPGTNSFGDVSAEYQGIYFIPKNWPPIQPNFGVGPGPSNEDPTPTPGPGPGPGPGPAPSGEKPRSVVYLMLDSQSKYDQFIEYLGANSKNTTLPYDKIVIGFFRPEYNYYESSDWESPADGLDNKGIFVKHHGDKTHEKEALTSLIRSIKNFKGPNVNTVQVFLSWGGWNYNCNPLGYTNSFAPNNATWNNNWTSTNLPKWRQDNKFYGFLCEPSGAMDGKPIKDIYTFFVDPGAGADSDDLNTKLSTDIYKGDSITILPTQDASNAGNLWLWPPAADPSVERTPIKGETTAAIGSKNNLKVGDSSIYRTYENMVKLATDVKADGIDLDYEEFWHADTYKILTGKKADQALLLYTKAKFARICALLMHYIDKYNTSLKLSFPSPAVAFISGAWWGGNLKGLMLNGDYDYHNMFKNLLSDDLFKKKFGADANLNDPDDYSWWNIIFDGGIQPMIYDVGGVEESHLEPTVTPPPLNECYYSVDAKAGAIPSQCAINDQLQFYAKTYTNHNVNIYLGFEVGRPAFPQISLKFLGVTDPIKTPGGGINGDLAVPLTTSAFNKIMTPDWINVINTTGKVEGAFYWEIFKNIANYSSSSSQIQNCCADETGIPKQCETDQVSSLDIAKTVSKFKWNGQNPTNTVEKYIDPYEHCKYNHCGCEIESCIEGGGYPDTITKCGKGEYFGALL